MTSSDEIVFCGFGEPTMRFEALDEIARYIKIQYPGIKLRLNTVGLGNLICGRNIIPELAEYLTQISISLNTVNDIQWRDFHRPLKQFGTNGFTAVCDFIEGCVSAGIDTRITAIENKQVNIKALEYFAHSIGASLMIRPALQS